MKVCAKLNCGSSYAEQCWKARPKANAQTVVGYFGRKPDYQACTQIKSETVKTSVISDVETMRVYAS
jgi:hypothetical protein